MSVRDLLLLGFLGLVFGFAALLALGWPIWWLAPVQWLGRYPLFHVVAHSTIFAGVVYLVYPCAPARRIWLWVVGGSVVLELVQFTAGGFVLTRALLLDSTLDIGVDLVGAAAAWVMLRGVYLNWNKLTPP